MLLMEKKFYLKTYWSKNNPNKRPKKMLKRKKKKLSKNKIKRKNKHLYKNTKHKKNPIKFRNQQMNLNQNKKLIIKSPHKMKLPLMRALRMNLITRSPQFRKMKFKTMKKLKIMNRSKKSPL